MTTRKNCPRCGAFMKAAIEGENSDPVIQSQTTSDDEVSPITKAVQYYVCNRCGYSDRDEGQDSEQVGKGHPDEGS